MAKMKTDKLSEEQIDEIVIAQADDDSAWEESIFVKANIQSTITLPQDLAARAAFFARLHRKSSVEEWIKSIIQERMDFEESAFVEIKQALSGKHH
jgi:hypothetical protein